MTTTEFVVIVAGLAAGYWIVTLFVGRNRQAQNFADSKENRKKPDADSNEGIHNHSPEHLTGLDNRGPGFQESRIFACPTCDQRIRVKLPPKSQEGKCVKCNDKFRIHVDDTGNLFIISTVHSGSQINSEPAIRSIEDCFKILELPKIATSTEIKAAYRKKMKEYHPDKVSSLGGKLKVIAEQETKGLNKAYAMLKDRGYL